MTAALQWREADAVRYLHADLGHGEAAFSTRNGGISAGPFRSLNLGVLTDDDQRCVEGNRRRLVDALARDPECAALGRQVHGTDIALRTSRPQRGELAVADGQLTARRDLTPLVLVADCIPLALAAPGSVAMVHCGWRGLGAGIVSAAVEATAALAKCNPSSVRAAIGPAIGPCCYEVGAEVVATFTRRGHQAGPMLDLSAIALLELERVGVSGTATCRLCTSCNADLFFSHRRDGHRTGRQAGLAWLT